MTADWGQPWALLQCGFLGQAESHVSVIVEQRGSSMKYVLVVVCALSLTMTSGTYAADAPFAHRPNIILVMADDK